MGSGRSKAADEYSENEDGEDEEEGSDSEEEEMELQRTASSGVCFNMFSFDSNSDFVSSSDMKAMTRRKVLVADNDNKTLDDYFDIELDGNTLLGKGGFASVRRGQSKKTGMLRAIKTMAKRRVKNDDQKIRKEIEAMERLDHPNIIKLFQTFEDNKHIYLVMEICDGGELFDKIANEGSFSEPIAATVMQQILRAVRYMHQFGVCHRDLKPENFLFKSKDPIENNTLKVIDFGISAVYDPTRAAKFTTKTGTPQYVAPEVLLAWHLKPYGPEVDLWSCGVIMFVILSATLPFRGVDDDELMREVKRANLQFRQKIWKQVSQAAKDLISNLIVKDPHDRYTATEALEDEWILGEALPPPSATFTAEHVNALKRFRRENKLKKIALSVVVRSIEEGQIQTLRDVFTQLDANADGRLTKAEVSAGLSRAGIHNMENDLQAIMDAVDADGSGEIDYTEFLAATMDQNRLLQESTCWAAFRVFDKDDDGYITPEELLSVLQSSTIQSEFDHSDIDELMEEIDENQDGYIDFTEFMKMMRRSA